MNSLITFWQWNGFALAGILFLCVLYAWYVQFKFNRYTVLFLAAIVLLVICFFSPLHILSEYYLFSAHMVFHVILLLVAGPLLVASLPEITNKLVLGISRLLNKKPFVGWLIGVGIMWVWHMPFIFNYNMGAMHMHSGFNGLAAFETVSLLVAGMLFSWPIIAPVKQYRISALSGVAYLFTACIGCSLLGLLITFAPAGIYNHFLAMQDAYHLNTIIVNKWGINQAMDQQIAGLIMWVPCCLLYVVYALYLLGRWYAEKEEGHDYVLHNR